MAVSNFPNGFPNGVTIREQPIQVLYPGKVFWVNNTSVLADRGLGGSDGNSGTYQKPFSTLAYALTQCVANRGDIIVLMPGHAETISSATALGLSLAGVCVLGLGTGAKRPTFTFDTATTATIAVSANNITIKNVIFSANYADIVAPFTLTTAADFVLEDVYIKATATNMNFLYIVDTDATTDNAAGLTLKNVTWIEPDTATVGAIKLDGSNSRVSIIGGYYNLGVNNNKSLITVATGKLATSLLMEAIVMYRLNTDSATGALLFHTDGSTNTGIIRNCHVQHADTAAELLLTASAGLGTFQNFASGVAGASGYLLPAADS